MSYLSLMRDPLVVLAAHASAPNSWGQTDPTFADSFEVAGNVQQRVAREIVGPSLGADVLVQTRIYLPPATPVTEAMQIRKGRKDTNEVQAVTITGSPTGGTFGLHSGTSTAPIAWNANAAAVQSALVGILGNGNVAVSGTNPTFTVTFQGSLANAPQPLLTLVSNALTGGTSPSVAIAEVTAGHARVAGVGYKIIAVAAPQAHHMELLCMEIRSGEIPTAPVTVQ